VLKRTILIQNPCKLNCQNEQLLISYKGVINFEQIPDKTVPMEDIGILLLEHKQISISHHVLARCMHYNIALICCNDSYHPTGMLLNLDGNTIQSERFKYQIAATEPLKKQLWQQIIISKINNQAAVFKILGHNTATLLHYAQSVKSGDTSNTEGAAAAHYWQNIFAKEWQFYRRRDGNPPNNLLNYGYSIIRAASARAIVAAGLMPTLGIFHRNRYNAYCLADDIMEPYRPYVDKCVSEILYNTSHISELNIELKTKLLKVLEYDVLINGNISPLLNAIQRTANSLSQCFEGTSRKLHLPIL
jgi:CRISP-associated protein Cas1